MPWVPKHKFHGLTPESRAKQRSNLRKGSKKKTALEEGKDYQRDRDGSIPILNNLTYERDIAKFLTEQITLPGRVKLRLEKMHRKFLADVFPKEGGRPYSRIMWGLPRKTGKSTLCSGIAIHQCVYGPVGGEVLICAGSREQAEIIYKKASWAVRRKRSLAKIFKLYADSMVLEARQGSCIRVMASDPNLILGTEPHLAIIDEFATSPMELIVALEGGMGALTALGHNPMLMLVGTAGICGTAQHELYKISETDEEEGIYTHWEHNPYCVSFADERFIERCRARWRPEDFQRFIMNEWVQSSGQFLSEKDIDQCIDETLIPQSEGKPDRRYVIGCDLGLRKDRTCIVVMHRHEGKVILDNMRVWVPTEAREVQIQEVEDAIRKWCKDFRVDKIIVDPWQMQKTKQDLEKDGFPVEEFRFTSASVGQLTDVLYSVAHGDQLRVFYDEELVTELGGLQIITKTYGSRMDHGPSGYSDRSIALAMAVHGLMKEPPMSSVIFDWIGTGDEPSEGEQWWMGDAGWQGDDPALDFSLLPESPR